MRLGASVFYNGTDPEQFALAHVEKGYGAAIAPRWLSLEQPKELEEFKKAMKKHDIVIAEVGVWNNPLHPDKKEAEKSIKLMVEKLRLAEEIGALTCVNILGTKQTASWFGPHAEDYSDEFFKEAVAVSQYVIDEVKPEKTKISFEMMPYCFLDCPEEYLRFLEAVDRKAAGVHLDICNNMNSPRRFYNNTAYIKHTFELLKDKIVTLHLKDIALKPDELTVAFEEVMIGTGGIDYITLLQEISKLPADTPAIIEHLETEAQYDMATRAVEGFAEKAGLQKQNACWIYK